MGVADVGFAAASLNAKMSASSLQTIHSPAHTPRPHPHCCTSVPRRFLEHDLAHHGVIAVSADVGQQGVSWLDTVPGCRSAGGRQPMSRWYSARPTIVDVKDAVRV